MILGCWAVVIVARLLVTESDLATHEIFDQIAKFLAAAAVVELAFTFLPLASTKLSIR